MEVIKANLLLVQRRMIAVAVEAEGTYQLAAMSLPCQDAGNCGVVQLDLDAASDILPAHREGSPVAPVEFK